MQYVHKVFIVDQTKDRIVSTKSLAKVQSAVRSSIYLLSLASFALPYQFSWLRSLSRECLWDTPKHGIRKGLCQSKARSHKYVYTYNVMCGKVVRGVEEALTFCIALLLSP